MDWLAGIANLWRKGFPVHNDDVPVHLAVTDLVLPCQTTTPDDALDFMALLNWLTPKRSFKSPEYSDVVLEGLARKFAAACQKLDYVRILNRAWDIVRRGGEPELRAYREWEVERKLPYAFDFGALPRVM